MKNELMYACSLCGKHINDKLIMDWQLGRRPFGKPIVASNKHELHMKYQRDYEPIDTTV